MLLRNYWAKAGASLMGISVAGVIAAVIALANTTRPHVPVWPWYACGATFITGLALFVFRQDEIAQAPAFAAPPPSVTNSPTYTPAAQVPTYPDRLFSDMKPAELLRTFRGQAGFASSNELGKWTRISGTLESVGDWNDLDDYSEVHLREFNPRTVFVRFFFTNPHVVRALACLSVDTKVTIVGEIDGVTRDWIGVNWCELESISTKRY